MSSQGAPKLAIGQIPHLHCPVPRGGHNGGLERIRAEPDTADPIGVGITVLDGVLALTKRVPQLDRTVTRSGHDLTVINRESNREDVFRVTHEAASRYAGSKVPEAELAVPGAGESELTVGGEDNILDEVGVASEAPMGDTVGLLLLGQVPEDDRFVARGSNNHVRVVDWGGDGRHLVSVCTHGAAKYQTLSHCDCGGLGLFWVRVFVGG